MTAPGTAPEAPEAPKAPEAPEAPKPPGAGSFISFPAIIVAALGAATVALIRPYLEMSTENTVVLAMFISVATTTSTATYKACVEKFTSCYQGRRWISRRWISILLAGLLAGLFACFAGIGGVSGAEVAMGKEPSILAPLPAPSSDPVAAALSPPISDPDRPILDYYEDVDHDGLGAGKSEQHERGEQRPGWVDNARDQCPQQPGPPDNDGCPFPNYYEDVDHDLLGAGPRHPEGKQLPGWVDNDRDQCPQQSGPPDNDGCRIKSVPEGKVLPKAALPGEEPAEEWSEERAEEWNEEPAEERSEEPAEERSEEPAEERSEEPAEERTQ
jgi:hypothetical protein